MAERSRVDPIAIVSRLARGPVAEDCAMEAEIALDTLAFLDAECRETACDPGQTAHFVVLDLAAALIAFGAVRSVDELTAWLREEVPDAAPRTHEGRPQHEAPIGGRASRGVLVDASGGDLARGERFPSD